MPDELLQLAVALHLLDESAMAAQVLEDLGYTEGSLSLAFHRPTDTLVLLVSTTDGQHIAVCAVDDAGEQYLASVLPPKDQIKHPMVTRWLNEQDWLLIGTAGIGNVRRSGDD